MSTTPTVPDMFDQVAAQPQTAQGQAAQQGPSPYQQPLPKQQPSQPQQAQGDIFDQVAVGAMQPAPASSVQAPQPSFIDRAGHLLGQGTEGVIKGVLSTTAGLGDIIHKAGEAIHPGLGESLIPSSGLQAEESFTHPHGTAQWGGYGGETLTEFLLGDEALKGLALSDSLLKSAKIAKVLEGSPRIMKAIQIGASALRTGVVQGADTYVKTGGDTQQAAGQGTFAGVLTGALGAGGETVQAIRTALDDSGLQPALQDGIRQILADAANKAGVSEPTAASIRDAAQQVSDGLKAKAQGLYKTLDTASGGQAQRFRDAAQNVSDQLRSIVGLDDEKEAELVKRQAEIEAAHQAMLSKLAAQGHDPNMLAQADAAWKQQSALSDLSNSIRQSTTGLRPELANGAKGATTPEAVNAKTLFTKINRLNDRGRLAQAIGQDNADALLQHVDAAYVQAQKFAQRNAWAANLAKVGLSTTGLGALGAGYEAAKHLFSGQ